MVELAAAVLLLILSHVLPSAPPVRARLIERFGGATFFAAYGVLSLVILIWVIIAFQRADSAIWLYLPPVWGRAAALGLMPLATFLVAGRLIQRPGPVPTGVYRITAAPGSLGLLLWTLLHLLNLGSGRHVLLFGGMATIALVALVKNARTAPGERRAVGVVPFLAVVRGRERLAPRELALPLLLGLLGYGLLLWLHPRVIGPALIG